MGWELPNPINAINSDESTRFPFALVQLSTAPTTYNVVFTVTDTGSDPVAGATITFGSQVKTTNASGQATFVSLGNSTYLYKVEKTGANTVFGEKAVTTSNTTVAVENF